MGRTPPLETIITLSIHIVISTTLIYVLNMLLCWLLVEYEVITARDMIYDILWIVSCISA